MIAGRITRERQDMRVDSPSLHGGISGVGQICCCLFGALLVLFCREGYSADNMVKIMECRVDKTVHIGASNLSAIVPYHIEIVFDKRRNAMAEPDLPIRAVVPAAQFLKLCVIKPEDNSKACIYELKQRQGVGDPTSIPETNIAYLLPYQHGEKYCIIQGYLSSVSHKNLHALDFELPEGT